MVLGNWRLFSFRRTLPTPRESAMDAGLLFTTPHLWNGVVFANRSISVLGKRRSCGGFWYSLRWGGWEFHTFFSCSLVLRRCHFWFNGTSNEKVRNFFSSPSLGAVFFSPICFAFHPPFHSLLSREKTFTGLRVAWLCFTIYGYSSTYIFHVFLLFLYLLFFLHVLPLQMVEARSFHL